MTIKMSSISEQVNITAHNKYRATGTYIWAGKYDYEYDTDKTNIKVLFDNPPTAFYFIGNNNEVGGYLQFDLRKPYVLYDYSFIHFVIECPKNFTFEGTNDPNKWNCVLDDQNEVK